MVNPVRHTAATLSLARFVDTFNSNTVSAHLADNSGLTPTHAPQPAQKSGNSVIRQILLFDEFDQCGSKRFYSCETGAIEINSVELFKGSVRAQAVSSSTGFGRRKNGRLDGCRNQQTD